MRMDRMGRMEKPTALRSRCGLGELVEDMEITFIFYLTNHPALFQQIIGDLSPNRLPMRVKHDLEIFPLEEHQ